jgi:hypothetical protein
MEGENLEEMKTRGYQRPPFGFEDTEIVYAGRKGGDYVTDPECCLEKKARHQSPKK